MKDIRVDTQGRNRCWNCGGANFTERRTTRSKVTFGVGALLTKKKLRCQSCGEYNDVGSAQPYTQPASPTAAVRSGAAHLDAASPPPGWYTDPSGQHEQRWWDGTTWTAATR